MKIPHFCGDYAHNIKEATPFLPKGYRFLNDGEAIPRDAKFITHMGLVKDSFGSGEEVMRGYLCPHIVKVAKKPPSSPKKLKAPVKSRVEPAAVDRLSELEKKIKELRAEIKALKEGIRKAVG